MPKKNAKSRRMDAERAAEHYVHSLGCVCSCRAVRTKWQSQDMFASDVIGKKADGSMVFVQATAGQNSAVSARRKKLERIPWAADDTVQVAQLVQTEDPANSRRKLWFFRIHHYRHNIGWITLPDAVSVKKEWFRAYKNKGD